MITLIQPNKQIEVINNNSGITLNNNKTTNVELTTTNNNVNVVDTNNNLEIIQNIKGDKGEQGYSAYEVACNNGYKGTEQEWLASLKGEKGDTPIKGIDYFDGEDGYTPIKGIDYFDGYTPIKGVDYFDGEKGDSPVKGVDYFDGEDGYTPIKGKDYFDGKDGYTPIKGKDYFDGYTPIKGKDYFDGKDGYTPIKGVDYFDGEDGYTPRKGIDYFDGVKGDDGVGIVSINKVDTTDNIDTYRIIYTNGTTQDYTITNGKNGGKGDKGDSIKGDKGFSAYEVACLHGFEGTEEEWLLSLNGEDGYTPIKGVDYFDGYTPIKGVDYFDGKLNEEQAAQLALLMDWYDKENYKDMKGTFTATTDSGTFEIGAIVKSKFGWSLTKEPTTLIVGGTSISPTKQSGETDELTFTSSKQADLSYEIYASYKGTYKTETASKKWTYSFKNKLYYGLALKPNAVDSDFIKGLSNSQYATDFENSGFNFNNDSKNLYTWYAYPARFENNYREPNFSIGGFAGGFEKLDNVVVKNSKGFEEAYCVWRTTTSGNGNLNVIVE